MPEPTTNPRLDGLLSRAADEAATAEEWRELEAMLAVDPAARRRYVQMMDLHVELRTRHTAAISPEATHSLPSSRGSLAWFSRHPLTAAAAGILFGMFCTSVVLAYVAPSFGKVRTLLQDGFESGTAPDVVGLPREIEKWSGDYSEIVGEQEGVKPAIGEKMLRFLGADYEGKSNAGPSRTASIWRLVDLRPHRGTFADGNVVAQLTAVFNAQTFPQGRSYFEFVQIHALDAATAAALKERDSTELNSSSLALTRSAGVELDRDPATWQRIDCEQRLPGNADYLLIEIGLKQMPKTSQSAEFAGHYVDDVRLTLTRRPLLP
jgi:hypothetical protein